MPHEHSPTVRTVALASPTASERYWQARALVAEADAAKCFSAYTAANQRAHLAEQAHARAQERTREALQHVEVGGELEGRLKAVQQGGEERERELARTRAALEVEREGSDELRRRIRELEEDREKTQGANGDALRLFEAAQKRMRARNEERWSQNA